MFAIKILDHEIVYRDPLVTDLKKIMLDSIESGASFSSSSVGEKLERIRDHRKEQFVIEARVRLGKQQSGDLGVGGDYFDAMSFDHREHRFGKIIEAAVNAAVLMAATSTQPREAFDLVKWSSDSTIKVTSGTESIHIANQQTKKMILALAKSPLHNFYDSFLGAVGAESKQSATASKKIKIQLKRVMENNRDEGCGYLRYCFILCNEGKQEGSAVGDRQISQKRRAFEREAMEELRASIEERLRMRHSSLGWNSSPYVAAINENG